MNIFIFGNPDVLMDSLPLRMIPNLQIKFPHIVFEVKDPNEEWDVPEELVIIDTALGLKDVTIFHDLDKFSPAPNISMHDFDALANLRYLQKLGRLKKLTIIAIPPDMEEGEASSKVIEYLKCTFL